MTPITRVGRFCYWYRQYLSLALLAASIVAAQPLTAQRSTNLAIDAAAVLLVLLGGGIRCWAMGYHGWRRIRGPGAERRLVTAGPYARVRNPLYLGTLLISAALALASGRWIVILTYLVVFWPGYYAIILWEEEKLDAQYGGRYRDYFASVPRLIPRLRAWSRPEGIFDLATTFRCMEPLKVVGFLASVGLMIYLGSVRGPRGY